MRRIGYKQIMYRILLPFFTSLLLIQPASAEIYKCHLPDGKMEISNRPCPKGSGTVTVRPDESVSEANRQQAERDLERMRNYVDKQESAQRAKAAAEQQSRSQRQTTSSTPSPAPHYGDPDACLRNLAPQELEATQRAQLEAECRSLIRPPESPAPVYGAPPYGGPNPFELCVENVQRQNLPLTEHNRRIAQCSGIYGHVPHPQPTPEHKQPPPPVGKPLPNGPAISICPQGKPCGR